MSAQNDEQQQPGVCDSCVYEQYDTKLEAKLHFFKIGSFIGRPRVNTRRPSSFKNEKK